MVGIWAFWRFVAQRSTTNIAQMSKRSRTLVNLALEQRGGHSGVGSGTSDEYKEEDDRASELSSPARSVQPSDTSYLEKNGYPWSRFNPPILQAGRPFRSLVNYTPSTSSTISTVTGMASPQLNRLKKKLFAVPETPNDNVKIFGKKRGYFKGFLSESENEMPQTKRRLSFQTTVSKALPSTDDCNNNQTDQKCSKGTLSHRLSERVTITGAAVPERKSNSLAVHDVPSFFGAVIENEKAGHSVIGVLEPKKSNELNQSDIIPAGNTKNVSSPDVFQSFQTTVSKALPSTDDCNNNQTDQKCSKWTLSHRLSERVTITGAAVPERKSNSLAVHDVPSLLGAVIENEKAGHSVIGVLEPKKSNELNQSDIIPAGNTKNVSSPDVFSMERTSDDQNNVSGYSVIDTLDSILDKKSLNELSQSGIISPGNTTSLSRPDPAFSLGSAFDGQNASVDSLFGVLDPESIIEPNQSNTILEAVSTGNTSADSGCDVDLSLDVLVLDVPSEDLLDNGQGAENIVIVFPEQHAVDADYQQNAVAEPAPTQQTRKRKNPPKPPPEGRKRTRTPSTWQKNETKAARHAGEAYISSSGKAIPAKTMKIPCRANCRLNCSKTISEEERQNVYNNFYRTKNAEGKWKFIKLYVSSNVPGRPKDKDNPQRRSRKYFLPINGDRIEVCQTMFLNTLVVSDYMVGTALKKNVVSPDKRGGGRKKVMIPDYVQQSIKDHIACFPRVASHYCRADSSFEYLEAKVKSVANMYRLYQKWIVDKAYGEKIATKRQYEDLFLTKHRIKFFQPRKDRCDDCVQYELNGANLSEEQKEVYEYHILKKDLAHKLASEDKGKYEKGKGGNVALCHYDLQKVFLLPHTDASAAYYKRKLTAFNFTIFDLSASQGHCYGWDERIGSKGCNEISSYVLMYLKQAAAEGKKIVIFWSDNCSAQNKNRFLFSMYLLASAQLGITILHRYLVKGHTQNEADSMHARIESACKNENLFVPEDWYEVMESAKLTGNPYIINRISTAEILNFRPLTEKHLAWPNGCRWDEVAEVLVDHTSSPWELKVKYDLGDIEYTRIHLKSKNPGRPVNLETYTPKEAYSGPLPITKAKKKDLMELCVKIIPQEKVAFFKDIKELQAGQKRKDAFYQDDYMDETIDENVEENF